MKKSKTQRGYLSKRNTTFSHLEIFRRRCSTGSRQNNSITVESMAQMKEKLHKHNRLSEGNIYKPPEGMNQSVIFPAFPSDLVKVSPEDFVLPDEYIRDHKNELMSPLPNGDLNIFGKPNVDTNDLADTVPIENIPASLLNMSPEKKDCNLPDARADAYTSFGKHTVDTSDLADTVPIENIPASLLKMSPDKKECNLPDARTDANISFGKHIVDTSDLADTVPIENIPASLLKMSPDKKECNLPDARTDANISFGKHIVDTSDLADTVPIENIPASLLKMSPEKKDCNLLETRIVSPILLHKPTAARSHLYSRRMKSLNSSVRSKRTIPKQIPLVLDNEVMKKINENLPILTQIDDYPDWRMKQEDSVSPLNEIDKDKGSHNAERLLQLSKFENHTLKVNNGDIRAAFCEHKVVIVVQESLITFVSINDQSKYGETVRRDIQSSVKPIFISNCSNDGSICACMEIVLVKNGSGEQQLTILVYTFNRLTVICSAYSIDLLKLPQDVSSLKVCSVQDCALVTSWSKDNNTSTQMLKYSLDDQFQSILKSTALSTVNGCVNSLHTLRGCQRAILGEMTSAVTIWDLHSGDVLKRVDFKGLTWSSYLWCEEDKGFLFSAVDTDKGIHITAANLTTRKFKVLRQYSVPEHFTRLSGLDVVNGILVATYPEGLTLWEVASSKVVLKTVTDLQLFLSKGSLICVASNQETSDIVLRVLDVTKLQ